MLDIRLIRQDPQKVEQRLRTKVPEVTLSEILDLDSSVRHKKTEVERLKAERNEQSQKIGTMKRQGEDCSQLVQEMTRVGDSIRELDQEENALESELFSLLAQLPNLPFDDVPISPDPKDNVELRAWGKKPEFSFAAKNHLELNETLGCFDFSRGAKITGSGWPVYKGIGARLEWALLNYLLDFHIQRGFIQWMLPLVVKRDTLFASGQLPKFENQQYRVFDDEHEMFLIPTAEVPLHALFLDEIIPEEDLPLKYVSYTPCFRREAGGAGAQERGLIRTHQFNKVEMFSFVSPEQSDEVFLEFVQAAEMLLQGLQLHHRSMLLTTGDMSFAGAKTIDIEVWLPGQNRYYEVSSVSHCTDYQARRGNIRFRRGKEKPEFVHTLNGSGLATSRLMVALLENNQQMDGSVVIPEKLRPYLGGLERLEPRSL